MNLYNIPINFIKKTGIKIEAANETEALKKVENMLKDYYTENSIKKIGVPEIQFNKITCKQDEKMYKELYEDFPHMGSENLFEQSFVSYKNKQEEFEKLNLNNINFININETKLKVYLNNNYIPDIELIKMTNNKVLCIKVPKNNSNIFNINSLINDINNINNSDLKIIKYTNIEDIYLIEIYTNLELINASLIASDKDKFNEYYLKYKDEVKDLYFKFKK